MRPHLFSTASLFKDGELIEFAILFATCEDNMCQTSSVRQVVTPEWTLNFLSEDLALEGLNNVKVT